MKMNYGTKKRICLLRNKKYYDGLKNKKLNEWMGGINEQEISKRKG